METFLSMLVCLSPLLLLGVGFYIGRYGSPIVVQFRGKQDRRIAEARQGEELESASGTDEIQIYRFNPTSTTDERTP